MKKLSSKSIPASIAVIIILILNSMPLLAENVFVVGFKGLTANATDQMPCPPTCVAPGFGALPLWPNGGASQSSASQVTNSIPVIPNAARRVHYGRGTNVSISFTPTNVSVSPAAGGPTYNFTELQNTGVYKIYLTKGQSTNASTNIVIRLTATENGSPAMLADTNGTGAASIDLDMYQRSKPNHVWVHVGYITNTTPNPTVTLTHVDGAIDDNAHATLNTGQRWYTDAIWFEFLGACVGVANDVGVTGPLVNGQTFANVTSVAAGATNVAVYVNGSLRGQTNLTGFAGGQLTVLLDSPLAEGDTVAAGQIKNGCSSTVLTGGPVVGGGPNTNLRAFLGMWRDSSLTGPIGANVITNTLATNYFLKASGLVAGFGSAFLGGETLNPSQCWQTVTFSHEDFNRTVANESVPVPVEDAYAALSGLAFAMADDFDSGPYEIYIDQIMNGDTVIENFEGYATGTTNTFNAPNKAATPNPSSLLSMPSSSVISQNNAFDGTNSCRIQWQWVDNSNVRWVHVLANASTNSGKHYPQIDTTKPITVRYLLLPAGETTNKLHFTAVPVNQTKAVGESATFSVTPAGAGPFTYQWRFQGNDITDATNNVYTKNGLLETDAGTYSVFVTGDPGSGCSATLEATLAINAPVAFAPVLSLPTMLTNGNFRFQITAQAGQTIAVQITTNLTEWVSVSTNVVPGTPPATWSSDYTDNPSGASRRFYRVIANP